MRIYLIFLLSSIVLAGCSDGGSTSGPRVADCGDPPSPVEYTVLGYKVAFVELISGEDVETDVNPEDFVIHLTSETESRTQATSMFDEFRFSLFERAYACSVHPQQIPTQIMETFTITSTGSFGDDYPPGENLIDLFLALESSPASSGAGLNSGPYQSRKMLLRKEPVGDTHSFTVTIELDDGVIFSRTSNDIVFNIAPD